MRYRYEPNLDKNYIVIINSFIEVSVSADKT